MDVMAEPREVTTRLPAVAGRFYPVEGDDCRQLAESYLRPAGGAAASPWCGALVPHAGWICSGAIVGEAMAAFSGRDEVDLVVVFGAVHTALPVDRAVLDDYARWREPSGESVVSQELRRKLSELSELFLIDRRFHSREHAIEVELPLIQLAWPKAEILPIEVPLVEQAVLIGRQTARTVQASGCRAVYLASSDLTHYGPNYGFTPAGVGLNALRWARDNDQRLLRFITELKPERIVSEVQSRFSACGGGAIAAMLAACLETGASRANVLRHASSYETLADVAPKTPDNAVGYAAAVVG